MTDVVGMLEDFPETADFLGMMATQEERKVARYEAPDGSLIVDTCAVTDADQPYETAISDLRYNPGKWCIVELYDTRKAAEEGHNRWIAGMISADPPKELVNASTATITKRADYSGTQRAWPLECQP